VIGIIGFNQVIISNQQNGNILGDKVYIMGIINVIAYLLVIYFNLFILVPKYLLKKKYISYLIALSLSMVLLLAIRMTQEFLIYTILDIPHARVSYFNFVTLLDNLSYFVINIVCIAGGSMTILLKQWIIENQRVSQMENMRIQSEVEQLKDQVNPLFLFNILNRTGILASKEPEKASQMVMKLSQLLRYQLYESSREKVLLSSEINFLTNYLVLESLYSDKLQYTITTEGDINRVFVPPLLFISFAQYAVDHSFFKEESFAIRFNFDAIDNHLYFSCHCLVAEDVDFSRITQRLHLLYGNGYKLSIIKGEKNRESIIKLELNL